MLSKILLTASLLGAAVAVPGGHGGYYGGHVKSKKVDANFDDLEAIDVINDFVPIGPYKYLDYQGLSVGSEVLAGIQLFGVTPHSPPNVAYSDIITDTFAGPALVAHYAGSKTKYFNLKSFYYACIDVSVTPVATAENCTITVTGYRWDDVVATQSFDYTQDEVLVLELDATMSLAKLDWTFTHLTAVDITYTNTADLDTPPSAIFDNFWYTVFLKKWS